MKTKNWFELKDIIARQPEKQSWTPLWQSKSITHQGKKLYTDCIEELYIHHLIAFPIEHKDAALEIKWENISLGFGNQPDTYSDEYKVVDIAKNFGNDCNGVYLCLKQCFDTDPTILHLNQDLVFALQLIREGDCWINPLEDGTTVAKIERDANSHPDTLKIRTDYLRDYLCARKMGAVIYTYHERSSIQDTDPNYWDSNKEQEGQHWRWTGGTHAFHEGTGMPYGQKTRVMTVTRENTDYDEDIPNIQARNPEDIKSDHFDKGPSSRKVYSTLGRLWINKWLDPLEKSSRVKGEEQKSNSYFSVDVNGQKICGSDLRAHEGWLWFKPDLIPEILKRDRACLKWYTRHTGQISFHRAASMHFGVNKEGLINIISEEIGLLDEYHKNILASFNVTPDGGVSAELLMSQKDGNPADTQAAEWFLKEAFKLLDATCERLLEEPILREHQAFKNILNNIHRFRAINETGLYELANDLNRVFVERLSLETLRKLSGNKEEKAGSIKELAKVVDTFGLDGKEFTRFLAGCYELRHGITHLPSSKIIEAYELAGLDEDKKPCENAERLILNIANTIRLLSNIIQENVSKSALWG